MKRATAGALALLALALIAGCGEKEEPATTGPLVTAETSTTTEATTTEAETTTTSPDKPGPATSAPAAVNAFLSSPDAAYVCDEVLTAAFLRSSYGDRAGCVAARRPATLSGPGTKLEVGRQTNAGTRVDAVPSGGIYDGDKLVVTVVRQGGDHLVAAVRSNAPVGP